MQTHVREETSGGKIHCTLLEAPQAVTSKTLNSSGARCHSRRAGGFLHRDQSGVLSMEKLGLSVEKRDKRAAGGLYQARPKLILDISFNPETSLWELKAKGAISV